MSVVGWVKPMLSSVDSRGVGFHTERDSRRAVVLVFIVLAIIFSFFILNLFVGVVVSSFNTQKEKLGKNFLLTKQQKDWLEMKAKCMKLKPLINLQ